MVENMAFGAADRKKKSQHCPDCVRKTTDLRKDSYTSLTLVQFITIKECAVIQ